MIDSRTQPGAGVRETNLALSYLGADTIVHENGVIPGHREMILSLPLEEIKAVRLLAPEAGILDVDWLDTKINTWK